MSRRPSLLATCLGAIAFAIAFAPTCALGKAVRVKWKKLDGAIKYELRLGQGRQGILQKILPRNVVTWQGELAPGFYTYQLRGIDRFDRPGEWSMKKFITIKPEKPEIVPQADSPVTLVNGEGRLFLTWKVKEPGDSFLVEYRFESEKVQQIRVQPAERQLELTDPLTGRYTWRIRSVIDPRDDGSERNSDEVAGSEFTSWASFKVKVEAAYLRDRRKFRAPVLGAVPPVLSPPKRGVYPITWTPVDGAEAYEIIVETEGEREPASVPFRKIVKELKAYVPVAANRAYTTRVRGVASIDAKGVAQIVGPEASVSYRTDGTVVPGFNGRLVVGGSNGKVGTEITSTARPNMVGNAVSWTPTVNLAADLWFGKRWGLSPTLDVVWRGSGQFLKAIRLNGALRVPLSSPPFGTTLVFFLGVGTQDYFGSVPPTTGEEGIDVALTTLGPSGGMELRKVLSAKWDASLGIRYFVPLAKLSAPSGMSLSTGGRFSNIAADLRVGYQVVGRWGAELSATYEQREISFSDGLHLGTTKFGGVRMGLHLRYEWE